MKSFQELVPAQRSAENERKSLFYQAANFIDSEEPKNCNEGLPKRFRDYVINMRQFNFLTTMVQRGDDCDPVWKMGDIRNPSDAQLELITTHMKLDSSPGMPLGLIYTTKKLALDCMKGFIFQAVRERIAILLATEEEDCKVSSVFNVENNYCDPVRVFIKKEAHKKSKADANRWRLIMSCSIIDEIIDRLIWFWETKVQIDRHMDLDVKPGMSFEPDTALEFSNKIKESCVKIRRRGYAIGVPQKEEFKNIIIDKTPLMKTDISGWDFSVKPWNYKYFSEVTCSFTNRQFQLGIITEEQRNTINTLKTRRIEVILRKVFVLSDGRAYAQLKPGIQQTGILITSYSNSTMRVGLAYKMGSYWAQAAGDDCNEDVGVYHAEKLRRYENAGFRVKDLKYYTEDLFEFCSHRYKRREDGSVECYPLNITKMMYNILSLPFKGFENAETLEILASYRNELKGHPISDRIINFIKSAWPLNAKMDGGAI